MSFCKLQVSVSYCKLHQVTPSYTNLQTYAKPYLFYLLRMLNLCLSILVLYFMLYNICVLFVQAYMIHDLQGKSIVTPNQF